MAPHARLHRRNARLAGDRCRVMAVHARDLILTCMHVMAEKNRLPWCLEITAVTDDGGLIPRSRGRSGLWLLAVRDHRWEGEDQQHSRRRKRTHSCELSCV